LSKRVADRLEASSSARPSGPGTAVPTATHRAAASRSSPRGASPGPRAVVRVDLLLGLVAAALVICAASTAIAEVRRYAIVIGTNHGSADEESLLFAEEDARKMAQVLGRFGGVAPEDLILLLDTDAATVERVMNEVDARVRRDESNGSETVLIVYYSGHADARSMHLGGTELGFREFKKSLKSSSADVRLFIIDACRSGEVTRVKGARPAEPFNISADDRLQGEGIAIITSSAASEDAQESDRLRGSFFTHHLVAAMLGAGDQSGDQRITLAEAYQYAHTETIRSTSSARFVQHPTYSFQIKGRSDLVLTNLDTAVRGQGQLVLEDAGSYVLFQDDDAGPVAAEVSVEEGTPLMLNAGRYLVRLRGSSAVYETYATVAEGHATRVERSEMRRVPYGRLVRKGLGPQTRSAWGVTTGATVSGELLPGTGATVLGTAGVQVDLEPLSLQLRLRYGQSDASNDLVSLEQRVLGGELAALRLFDLGDFALGFGVRGGADWISQTLTTDGVAPDRGNLTGRAGAVLHVAWAPAPWLTIWMEGASDAYFAQVVGADGKSANARFVPYGAAGLNLYVF
jgi:hypothetical protein